MCVRTIRGKIFEQEHQVLQNSHHVHFIKNGNTDESKSTWLTDAQSFPFKSTTENIRANLGINFKAYLIVLDLKQKYE